MKAIFEKLNLQDKQKAIFDTKNKLKIEPKMTI